MFNFKGCYSFQTLPNPCWFCVIVENISQEEYCIIVYSVFKFTKTNTFLCLKIEYINFGFELTLLNFWPYLSTVPIHVRRAHSFVV